MTKAEKDTIYRLRESRKKGLTKEERIDEFNDEKVIRADSVHVAAYPA